MNHSQAIPSPSGVSVFGSALLRVLPDLAVLKVAALGLDQKPEKAFGEVRDKVESIQKFLRGAGVSEVASSRVTLRQEYRYSSGEQRFVGYLARVGFQIVLRDLNRVEPTLVGVVSAGASEVLAADFQTSELREHRLEARRRAVRAAHEKALAYCESANARLGSVIHIEDVNPDVLTGIREGHVQRQVAPDDAGDIRAFDPGAITVGAAVTVVYSLAKSNDATPR